MALSTVFYDDFQWRFGSTTVAQWNPAYWGTPVVSSGNATTAAQGYGWLQGTTTGGYAYIGNLTNVPTGDFEATGTFYVNNTSVRGTIQWQASGNIVADAGNLPHWRSNGHFLFVEGTNVNIGTMYQGTRYMGSTSATISLNTWYKYRVALHGQDLKLRVWPETNAEVITSWNATTAFGVALPAGNIHAANKGQTLFYVDNIQYMQVVPDPVVLPPYKGWGLELP